MSCLGIPPRAVTVTFTAVFLGTAQTLPAIHKLLPQNNLETPGNDTETKKKAQVIAICNSMLT